MENIENNKQEQNEAPEKFNLSGVIGSTVYDHVRHYLDVSIEHHDKKMKENAEWGDYMFAQTHKTCKEVFIGMRCQMDADFNYKK